jgi:hypothetical protein
MILENRVFRTFVFALAGGVLVFFAVGYLLADEWQATTSRLVPAPVARVEALLCDLASWQDWSGWQVAEAAELRRETSGVAGAPGQQVAWRGPDGAVILRLATRSQGQLGYEFLVEPPGAAAVAQWHGSVRWQATAAGTEVTWHDGGRLDLLVLRWQAFFGSLQAQVARHQGVNLDGLAAAAQR